MQRLMLQIEATGLRISAASSSVILYVDETEFCLSPKISWRIAANEIDLWELYLAVRVAFTGKQIGQIRWANRLSKITPERHGRPKVVEAARFYAR